MPLFLYIISSFFLLTGITPDKVDRSYILSKVNEVRAQGCMCGGTYYASAPALKWDATLYQSAISHAKEMDKYNYFGHFSKDGKDIGDRLDTFNYPWQVVGENLGEGQRSFDEVLRDWIKSPSHCQMLMDPRVDEMAVAKYRKFWVQHFGKRLPKKAIPHKRKR